MRTYYSEKWLEPTFRKVVEGVGGKAPKFVSPGNKGVPDRLVLLPGGWVGFAEIKSTGQTLEPLQIWWRDKLIAMGFPYFFIDDLDSLNNAIRTIQLSVARS